MHIKILISKLHRKGIALAKAFKARFADTKQEVMEAEE